MKKQEAVKVEWISVDDRMPGNGEQVLVVIFDHKINHEIVADAEWQYGKWVLFGWDGVYELEEPVLFWMPYPNPPVKQ